MKYMVIILLLMTSCTVLQLPEPEAYQDTQCKVFVMENDTTWKCDTIQ
jgi:hypothetical protein